MGEVFTVTICCGQADGVILNNMPSLSLATSLTLTSSADGAPEVLVRCEKSEKVLAQIGVVKIPFCSSIVNQKYKVVAT